MKNKLVLLKIYAIMIVWLMLFSILSIAFAGNWVCSDVELKPNFKLDYLTCKQVCTLTADDCKDGTIFNKTECVCASPEPIEIIINQSTVRTSLEPEVDMNSVLLIATPLAIVFALVIIFLIKDKLILFAQSKFASSSKNSSYERYASITNRDYAALIKKQRAKRKRKAIRKH